MAERPKDDPAQAIPGGGGPVVRASAFARLFERYRPRLRRLLASRMDRRLQARFDPSDAVQETLTEAYRRLAEYPGEEVVPFYVWLRFLAVQRVALLRRTHLGAQGRDARRESSAATLDVRPSRATGDSATAVAALVRGELSQRLRAVLESLEPLDRQILDLRHFQQLSNVEAARLLDLKPTAACNRYVRALDRLGRALRLVSERSSDWIA